RDLIVTGVQTCALPISKYFGPYFPGNLAHRIVDIIHRSFMIPSCNIDLTRFHARPCLQYYIKRCLGPCVKDLTTEEIYAEAVRRSEERRVGKEWRARVV